MKESDKDSLLPFKYLTEIFNEKDIIKKVNVLSEFASTLFAVKICTIWLKENEQGVKSAEFWRLDTRGRSKFDLNDVSALISDAAINNKIVMTAAPRRCANYNEAIDGKAKAMLILPVHFQNSEKKVAGVIQLCDKKDGGQFSNQDLKTANLFEQLAGSILTSVYNDLENEKNMKEIIYALAESGERRRQKKSCHVIRVAESCVLIAGQLGLRSDEVAVLHLAAALHDIGKMTIPDFVLLKPAKLTKDEFSLIKAHTRNGADILCQYDNAIMNAAAIVALQHHEKYNGKGYPNGLSGEDIHIFAQITALADVFDVLMIKNVYKEPWALEDALAHIRSESGGHFSPAVTEAFFAVLPDILKLRELYEDDKN